jgi:uncharacterized RmlC-like cupin family protein
VPKNEEPLSIAPGQIPWENENPDGTRSATLVGVREPGVTFTYAFFIPPNVWDAPHFHLAASHLHVVSGVLHLGYGRQFDQQLASPHPAGSFLYVPAGAIHFDGSSVETIIIGTATGPWSTDYV